MDSNKSNCLKVVDKIKSIFKYINNVSPSIRFNKTIVYSSDRIYVFFSKLNKQRLTPRTYQVVTCFLSIVVKWTYTKLLGYGTILHKTQKVFFIEIFFCAK